MKSEEIEELKTNYGKLLEDKNRLIYLRKRISQLEKLKTVKEYKSSVEELDSLLNKYFKNDYKQSDAYFLSKAVRKTHITPTYDTYVYLGSYGISFEPRSNCDRLVSFGDKDTEYVLFRNIELPDCDGNRPIKLSLEDAKKFVLEHNIIYPENTDNYGLYFYELQLKFFNALVNSNESEALKLINKKH